MHSLCLGTALLGLLLLELGVVVVASVGARHVVAVPVGVGHGEAETEADAEIEDEVSSQHARDGLESNSAGHCD